MSEDRSKYFSRLRNLSSPIETVPDLVDQVVRIRKIGLNDPSPYLHWADELQRINRNEANTRAEFIRKQCAGEDCNEFFLKHCESWGIPIFKEGLITVNDFENGFMKCFRDHSTSWCEDSEARYWFYTSIEARFITRYEFWACDSGEAEMVILKEGNYKSILWESVKEAQEYGALISPVFNNDELKEYNMFFNEEAEGIEAGELLEILEQNPNWKG